MMGNDGALAGPISADFDLANGSLSAEMQER
jgi:hypothetical protein